MSSPDVIPSKALARENFEPTFFSIVDMIAVNASHCPRDIAWVEGEMEINWRELNRQIDQFAHALKDNGLQQGESVALLGGNSFWSYLTGFATMRAGGVICPMSTLLTPTMLLTLVDDCGAKLLFVDAGYLDLAQQVRALTKGLELIYAGEKVTATRSFAEFIGSAVSRPFYLPLSASDPANIIYSSGTTGTPKGIVHSHGARVGFSHQIGHGCRYSNQSRVLVSTSPNSNATWAFIFPAIWLGGTVITMGLFDVADMLDQIARHSVSHMFIVPTQARAIVDNASSKDANFSSLECVITAGAPMPLVLKDAMRDLIGEKLYELWGFSESVGTIIAPEEMRQRPESVGRSWTGSELRIIDDNDGDITGRGQGEIVGRTTSTMCGYLNRDEANREIAWYDEFHRLYLRTGDIGELDEDGYLTLRGRKKDMISSGGLNVFPVDIEKVLLQHDDIIDVSVFGAEHQKWGETPVAAVLLVDGSSLSSEDIKNWANDRLAKFQRLFEVVVYSDDFPRNNMGKVLKSELKDAFQLGAIPKCNLASAAAARVSKS